MFFFLGEEPSQTCALFVTPWTTSSAGYSSWRFVGLTPVGYRAGRKAVYLMRRGRFSVENLSE